MKQIKRWQIFATIICLILGVILHFTYEWSNENNIVAAFSAVNESTWEHLKLVVYPILLTSIVGKIILKKDLKNYWFATLIGMISAIAFITVFFYTYTGIIGKNFAILDIGSFFVGVFIAEYIIYKLLISSIGTKYNIISSIAILVITFSFIYFTYHPLKINYFQDPVNKTYGIYKEM